MLIMTVGISGSGKSYLKNRLTKDFELTNIEPDEIRREILGDVNDQSQGFKIFSIAKSRIKKIVNDKLVFFNATSLDWKRNIEFVLDLELNPETPVLFLFVEASQDIELCKSRIKSDLEADVDRARVPDDIIESQQKRYKKCKQDIMIYEPSMPANWQICFYTENYDELCEVIGWMNNGNS